VMLMLAAYRRLPILDRDTRSGRWDKEACRGINRHLNGKTVGIVGFGAIGRTVARLLSGFGVDILYFDPIRAPAAVETELKAAYLDLDALLARADVVSLHLPLAKETANLIDARRIALMKPGALLVNCARGGLVDEAALVEALKAGHLFGAAIDAFAQEPPLGSPLLELEETVVTPHAAGATLDNFASIVRRAVENAKAYLAGQDLPPGDVVIAPRKKLSAG
jgi:phosphoglycerate dehydrogenase-like enzyme